MVAGDGGRRSKKPPPLMQPKHVTIIDIILPFPSSDVNLLSSKDNLLKPSASLGPGTYLRYGFLSSSGVLLLLFCRQAFFFPCHSVRKRGDWKALFPKHFIS